MKKIFAVILFTFVILFALLANEKEDLQRGKKLYIEQCSKCHRKNGKGIKTVYPPLKNSDYIKNGDKIELLRGMLFGRKGKITVNGYTYQGVMTTEIDKSLSDRDIALILNYVYKVLNKMDVQTTAEDVKKARKAGKLKSHKK
jgi:mono/diheme cytochrome c family protein